MICILQFNYFLLNNKTNKANNQKISKLECASSIHIFIYKSVSDITKYIKRIYETCSPFYFKSSYQILYIIRGNEEKASGMFNYLKTRRAVLRNHKISKSVLTNEKLFGAIFEYKEKIDLCAYSYEEKSEELNMLNTAIEESLSCLELYSNGLLKKMFMFNNFKNNKTFMKEDLDECLEKIKQIGEINLIQSSDIKCVFSISDYV